MSTGLIFDIKRYAINDGPGIRLTVFFKGCTLDCQWCHNPESISTKKQKMYNATKCIGALECVTNCPNEALEMTEAGIVTNYDVCNFCGKCAEVCPTKAFEMMGEHIPLSELMQQIDNEAVFFDQSDGGVTFSGGEPLMHKSYLLEALKACGQRMYHRVVDTTCHASEAVLLEVAAHTEMFLVDLKLMNAERHKHFTGVGNEKILSNIQALAKTECDILFRIPLIKGVNLDDANIEETAAFINNLEGERNIVNLLPYHSIAENKHLKMGEPEKFTPFEEPTKAEIENVISIFKEYGINASEGG